MLADARSATVHCWAMGITQHRNAVATIKEIVNVALAAGQHRQARRRPVPGARPLQRPGRPHDGHLGASRPTTSSTRCATSSASSRRASTASTPSTRSGRCATARRKVFIGLGGNFVSAAPDTVVTEQAMRSAELTVQVSTKLNRSHVVCGRDRADPARRSGRSERTCTGGVDQRVTVEDSMSAVHASRGPLEAGRRRSCAPRSTSSAGIAEATLGDRHGHPVGGVPRRLHRDPPRTSPAWCRAARRTTRRCDQPGGFVLPHPPRDSRDVPDRGRQGGLHASARWRCCTCPRGGCCCRRCAATTSSTPRSTGSTTATAASRAAAAWSSCTPTTSRRSGFADGDLVDLVSEWEDGIERTAPSFRIVAYDTPRGCAAAYYPETNPLVPLDSTARGSNCPTSKSVIVRLERATGEASLSSDQGSQADGRRGPRPQVRRGAGAPELTVSGRWSRRLRSNRHEAR